MSIKITNDNFDVLLQQPDDKPVLVVFLAEWCSSCKMLAPVVEAIARDYAGQLVVGRVDVDSAAAVSTAYDIHHIPALLFFKDGKLIDKHTGAIPKAAIVEKITHNFLSVEINNSI